MKYEDFYKLLTHKMNVVGRAREESYNKLHRFLEGMSPNDPALPEIANLMTETEKNLQDMMKVINVVVDRQLEAYDSINTKTEDSTKKRQEGKHVNGRPKVTFVDESDNDEAKDENSTVERSTPKKTVDKDNDDSMNPSGVTTEKENRKGGHGLFMLPMPASPILSSTAANSLLASLKKPASTFRMPTTPPTTQKSRCNKNRAPVEATPKMLNFDDTFM